MCIEELWKTMLGSITLIYPSSICAINEAMSSCNTIGVSLIEDNSQDSQICFIVYINHTYS